MTQEKVTHSNSQKLGPQSPLANRSFGKMIALASISLVMCLLASIFPFLPLLAAVPMGISILLFGNSKILMLNGLILSVLTIAAFSAGPSYLFTLGSFLVAMTFAYIITYIIRSDINPQKGMVWSGSFLFLGIALIAILYSLLGDSSLVQLAGKVANEAVTAIQASKDKWLMNADAQTAEQLREVFKITPEKLTELILFWTPITLFGGIYFGIWIGLFLILRNQLVWRPFQKYSYTLKDFIAFRVPDQMIFLLIFALFMALTGEQFLGKNGEIIGVNILYMLGVFYFFQGFGVFVDFLAYAKIYGIIRNIMVIMSIFMAPKFLAIIGVADVWVNFRKFFNKNKDNEGDIL